MYGDSYIRSRTWDCRYKRSTSPLRLERITLNFLGILISRSNNFVGRLTTGLKVHQICTFCRSTKIRRRYRVNVVFDLKYKFVLTENPKSLETKKNVGFEYPDVFAETKFHLLWGSLWWEYKTLPWEIHQKLLNYFSWAIAMMIALIITLGEIM